MNVLLWKVRRAIASCVLAVRLEKGLATLNVLKEMRRNTVAMREAFVHTHAPLDATSVENLFANVRWSASGSDRYKREARAMSHWLNYLQELEGKRVVSMTLYPWTVCTFISTVQCRSHTA